MRLEIEGISDETEFFFVNNACLGILYRMKNVVTVKNRVQKGYICISIITQFNYNICHLVPEGTPGVLIPLMVVIESVRILIRPFTLAVRLAANIIAGHLLLSLLGGQAYNRPTLPFIILIIGLSILITLECAVACIQAYVFMILSGLYANDHNSRVIN